MAFDPATLGNYVLRPLAGLRGPGTGEAFSAGLVDALKPKEIKSSIESQKLNRQIAKEDLALRKAAFDLKKQEFAFRKKLASMRSRGRGRGSSASARAAARLQLGAQLPDIPSDGVSGTQVMQAQARQPLPFDMGTVVPDGSSVHLDTSTGPLTAPGVRPEFAPVVGAQAQGVAQPQASGQSPADIALGVPAPLTGQATLPSSDPLAPSSALDLSSLEQALAAANGIADGSQGSVDRFPETALSLYPGLAKDHGIIQGQPSSAQSVAGGISDVFAPVRAVPSFVADRAIGALGSFGSTLLSAGNAVAGVEASALGFKETGAQLLASSAHYMRNAKSLALKGWDATVHPPGDGDPSKPLAITSGFADGPDKGSVPVQGTKERVPDLASFVLGKPVDEGAAAADRVALSFPSARSLLRLDQEDPRIGNEMARAVAYRNKLASLMDSAVADGQAKEAGMWAKRISQLDEHIRFVDGMQAVNDLRRNQFIRAERVLSHYTGGVPVTIEPQGRNKFRILVDGIPSEADSNLTKTDLASRLRSLFDSAYKENMAAIASKQVDFQFKLNLEQAKAAFKRQFGDHKISISTTGDGETVLLDQTNNRVYVMKKSIVQGINGEKEVTTFEPIDIASPSAFVTQ